MINAKLSHHKLSEVSTLIKSVPKKNAVISPLEEKTIAQYLGRYCLDVPSSMNRCREFYKIGDTLLQEEHFAYPFEEAFEHSWQKNIAKIEALKKKRSSINDLRGKIIEKRLLTNSMKGVFFCGNETNHAITLNALFNAGAVGLWLQIDGYLDKLEQMGNIIKKISATYHSPEKAGCLSAGKDWFCLTHGAIACSPLNTEEASVCFSNQRHNIEISISAKTIKTPTPGLFERFELTMMNPVAWKNGGITFLKKKIRKIELFKGEELFYHDENKDRLSFLWNYTGEPKSGRYPEISVSLNAPGKDCNEMVKLWENVLNSIRNVNSLKHLC